MNHLHFIDVKPSIDKKETASIKDAIFKRAKQKAQALADEKQENYSADVKNDVMDIARTSLADSPMNPFNQFMENINSQRNVVVESSKSNEVNKNVQQTSNKSETADDYTREVKHNIESVSNNNFVNSVKNETMQEARKQFRTNLNAMLNFLNTQAAIKSAKDAHSKINYLS